MTPGDNGDERSAPKWSSDGFAEGGLTSDDATMMILWSMVLAARSLRSEEGGSLIFLIRFAGLTRSRAALEAAALDVFHPVRFSCCL